MTERHDDQGDQNDHDALDDELARALRAEVPAPGPGYWDGIDAMLERVAGGPTDMPGPSGTAEDHVDTGTTVIRLTAMNETDAIETDPHTTRTTTARHEPSKARRFGGTSLLARAAVLTILLGAIGAIAWIGANNGDGPGETVNGVAGPGTEADGEPANDPETSATSEPTTEGTEDPAAQPEVTAEPELTVEPSDDVDPATGGSAARPEWVGTLVPDELVDADIEAIGCWFRVDQDVDSDVVFHGGFEGGYMILQGELVELAPLPDATEIDWWTVTDYADLTAAAPRWEVSLTDIGERVETSIESADYAATLTVAAADGTTWSTRGVLGCGV